MNKLSNKINNLTLKHKRVVERGNFAELLKITNSTIFPLFPILTPHWAKRLILSLIATILMLSTAEPAVAHPGHGTSLLPDLTEKILTPQLTITGLSFAFCFGAVHALTPGHGKTLVTAYLVGSKATPLQAIFLSLITTLTHTITIFILGFLVLFASQYVLPEQLYLVLSLLSGITICAIGCWRLESYFNTAVRSPTLTTRRSVREE